MPTKRIPLTGTYNTRLGSVALSGSSAIVGAGIVGIMVVGSSGASGSGKDTRFINCFQITQSDETAQSKRLYVADRPGFAAHSTPAAGSIGTAIHVWTGLSSKVMSCFGGTNSTLYDGTTSKGAITGLARGIVETKVSGTPTLLIASSDSSGWYYQDGGTATEITDGDFPATTVGNFAAMDGYAFIMDSTGKVYNSDINSVTAWTANSYFDANSVPDSGVGVVRHRDLLIAFCKEHFEVLYNAANPTLSPLARIDERTQRIGCVSADAIAEVRDTIYFAGATKGSNIAIYSLDGGQLGKVSTPEIEVRLNYAGPSSISLTTLGFFGRHFVVVCAGMATYVYCIEEKVWHEWSGTQYWYKADGATSGTASVNYAISKISTAGKVFVLNPLSINYQDNGESITALIQTAKIDMGTADKKTWESIGIIGDQLSATLYVAWQDDDYQTQSTPRTLSMATDRPRLRRCGRSRSRSLLLTHQCCGLRLEAVEIGYEVGST
jgi:hypothetical protein